MIINMIKGDAWNSPYKHIAFAVCTEGDNKSGYAGYVASHYWKALAKTGEKKLGETMSYEFGDRILHALVCFSFTEDGWNKTPEALTKCFDSLNVPEDEPIAFFLMGVSKTSQKRGSDIFNNLGGIARSRKSVTVYALI